MARDDDQPNKNADMPDSDHSKDKLKEDGGAVLADINGERGTRQNNQSDKKAISPDKDNVEGDDTSAVLADLNDDREKDQDDLSIGSKD
jgi:hypothetical protein